MADTAETKRTRGVLFMGSPWVAEGVSLVGRGHFTAWRRSPWRSSVAATRRMRRHARELGVRVGTLAAGALGGASVDLGRARSSVGKAFASLDRLSGRRTLGPRLLRRWRRTGPHREGKGAGDCENQLIGSKHTRLLAGAFAPLSASWTNAPLPSFGSKFPCFLVD